MTALAQRFGEAVDAARRERGWTFRELAAQAGINRNTAGSVVHCKYGTSLEVAYALARALGVSLDEMTAERAP